MTETSGWAWRHFASNAKGMATAPRTTIVNSPIRIIDARRTALRLNIHATTDANT
jgi:hypothetical protein